MEAQPTTRAGKPVPFAEQNEAWQVQEATRGVRGFAELVLATNFSLMATEAKLAFVATYSPGLPGHLRAAVVEAIETGAHRTGLPPVTAK
jgi:hypothetical protein